MKATIENDFVYSEFLPMRGDKLETDNGEVIVAGTSATQILVCGNLTGMLYMLELVGVKGRFQWRKRQSAENTDDKTRGDILDKIGPDDV
jgi:hypothetical protein